MFMSCIVKILSISFTAVYDDFRETYGDDEDFVLHNGTEATDEGCEDDEATGSNHNSSRENQVPVIRCDQALEKPQFFTGDQETA